MYRCPYLGLDDDRGMYCLFANQHHCCYRSGNPRRITAHHQEAFCLQGSYATCPEYRGSISGSTQRPRRMFRIAAAAVLLLLAVFLVFVQARGFLGSASTATEPANPPAATDSEGSITPAIVLPISVVPEPGANTPQGESPTATATSTVADGDNTVSITATLHAQGQLAASPTSAVTSATTSNGRSEATPSLSPSLTPSPSPTATPASQEQPSPSPTPTRPPQQVHVVVFGESLTSIARRNAITVDKLAEANGLSNTSHIYTGQRLIVP